MNDGVLLLRTALATLIFLQAGLWLLVLLHDDRAPLSLPETLSAAFGLGVGAITFELLLMGLAPIRFQLSLVLAPWLLAWAIVAVAARARLGRMWRGRATGPPARLTPREEFAAAALLCLPVGIVVLVFVHAWIFPIAGWDEWAIWDLKARAFWVDGGIRTFLAAPDYWPSHFDYPLLSPLAGTLFYLALGAPHHVVQFIPATFFLCSLVQFAAGLRRFGASSLSAVAFTGGLACLTPLLYAAQVFNAEAAYTYYLLTSTISLILYLREGGTSRLLLAAMTAGFATQVRPEGVLLFAAPLAVLLIHAGTRHAGPDRRRALIACAVYAGVVAAIFLPWAIASRLITAPIGRELGARSVTGLITNRETIVHALAMVGRWTVNVGHLGPFALLVPLATGIVIARRRQIVGDWGAACLLITAIFACVPYLGWFVARPEALHADAMGRYFVVAMTLLYLFVAWQIELISGGVRRLIMSIGGLSLVLWMAADLLGWMPANLFFHLRPVESARIVFSHAEALATLTPVQRVQWVDQENGFTGFAAMLPALVAKPLPDGAVILFGSPGNQDSASGGYVHARLLYLVYPHPVVVIDDQGALERALAAAPAAALIVYRRAAPLDRVAGEVTFELGGRFSVIRAPRLRP